MRRQRTAPSALVSILLAIAVATPATARPAHNVQSAGMAATRADMPGTWSLAGVPPGPDGRVYPQVTASPELGITVVFGGLTEDGTDNDTYWIDTSNPAAEWKTLDPEAPAPPARTSAAVAWDPDQHRMLMFGGVGTVKVVNTSLLFGQDFLNDVWALQFDPTGATPPRWEELHSGGLHPVDVPVRRAAAAAVYDPVGKRLIMHGGNDTVRGQIGAVGETGEAFTGVGNALEQGLDDIWSFDLTSKAWTKLAGGTPGQDPNLLMHQAVYDPVSRQVVVTGGITGGDPYSFDFRYNADAWSFDLQTNGWTKWSPDGDSPAMAGGAYGYSESLGALVVARGMMRWGSEMDRAAIYAMTLGPGGQGAGWEVLPSRGLPFPLFGFDHGTSGAIADDTLVVMGGLHQYSSNEGLDCDARVSAFDIPSRRWRTVFSDVAAMTPTAEAAAVYDSTRHHMLVVGGRGRPGTVWDLDLSERTWERLAAPGSRPAGAKNLAAAYDAARQRLLVLSGSRVHALNLVGQPRWTVLDLAGDAPSLEDTEAFYDPIRDRLVLVAGGFIAPEYKNYFGSWQQPDLNQKVFAVHLSGTPAWRELSLAGPAPERIGARIAYDPTRDRILLFGGRDAVTFNPLNDVLELPLGDGGAWRTVSTSGLAPSARTGSVVAYDSANDRLLAYGGDRNDPATYALGFGGTPTWSKLTTTGDPVGREEAVGVYASATSQLIVSGGYLQGQSSDAPGSRDTYALELGGSAPAPPTPAPLTHTPPGRNPVRGGEWAQLGPAGARTIPIEISAAFEQDHTMYAGTVNTKKTENEAAGIYVSRDRGATWHSAGGDVQGAAILRIAPSPADPNVVYAAARAEESGEAVYVSRDRGETWTDASTGLPTGAYYALAAHPSQPDTAWTAGHRGGLYRTTDGGASWQSLGFEDEWVYGLTAIPRPQGVRVLAATRNLSSDVHGSGRAFLSDDLGETWDLVYLDQDYVTYGFAYDPSEPSRVLLSSGNGIWRSEDGGRTWEWLADRAIQAAWLAFDPQSNGRVVYGAGVALPVNFSGFAGGSVSPAQTPGLFRSTDGGKTWARVPSTPEEDFGGVAVAPDGTFVAASSIENGPYISENGGQFTSSTKGFFQFVTASIAVDAVDPNHLIAATEYDGVRVSTDAGATWKRYGPSDGQPFWYAAASPVKGGRVVGGNYSNLYKSENGGRTWSQVALDGRPGMYFRQSGGIAFHPTDANTWYVSMADGRVAVTRDNGGSFEYDEVGGFASCLIPIATSVPAPNVVLVGDVCGSGVWRSDDGGRTWAASSTGLDDTNISALAFHPTDRNVVWAGTLQRGVYRSDDQGRTWRAARTGLGYRYVRFLTVDPSGRLFAAVHNGGAFESDDGGTSWTPVNDGLTNRDTLHVVADSLGRVFAATKGGGVSLLTPPT